MLFRRINHNPWPKISERKHNTKEDIFCLRFFQSKVKSFFEKVSFGILTKLQKGSMTVEAAAALPLFLLGILSMASFLDLYRIETLHLSHLCDQVKEAALISTGGDVTCSESYLFHPFGGMFPLSEISLHTSLTAASWNGDDDGLSCREGMETEEEDMVLVTETGAVFHEDPDCTYLNLSVKRIPGDSVADLRNQYNSHYGPCGSCCHGENPASIVYVTEKGKNYHNRADCSGLKRTVYLVPKSQTEGKHSCSRCGDKGK